MGTIYFTFEAINRETHAGVIRFRNPLRRRHLPQWRIPNQRVTA